MIVEVIDVRVRSFVETNCSKDVRNAGSGERRRRPVTSLWAASGLAVQSMTSRIERCPSAAAWSNASRTRQPCCSQYSRSPLAPPCEDTAESRSAARSAAATGFSQSVSGSNVIVEGTPPSPGGLKVNTGPLRSR
jgi:hypothetical protein